MTNRKTIKNRNIAINAVTSAAISACKQVEGTGDNYLAWIGRAITEVAGEFGWSEEYLAREWDLPS